MIEDEAVLMESKVPELEEIRQKYDSGQLEGIKQDLERFLAVHRQAILNYRAEQQRKGLVLTDDAMAKFYLLRHRTINAQREIQEQLEEIQKEKWIQGIKYGQPPDAQRVANEWTSKYSRTWRAYRVTMIVYVFDREKERYLKLLMAPPA